MTDEQLRIRGYLKAQGAKLTPGEVIDKVRAAMDDLRASAAAVPADRFHERPEPEEWSANEVMAHVVDAGRYFGNQIIDILEGASPAAVKRDPTQPERQTAGGWWAILERDRSALFERVRRADPQQALGETIEHGMFGSLNWREVLLFMRLHDLDHAGQLAKIAAAFTARPGR